jgi:tetratricopeptide (TPR) repeat protein
MSAQKITRRTTGRRPCALAAYLTLPALLAFLAVGTAALPEAHAAKKESSKVRTDPRELQAREAFAASRYREALDLYAKLFAEKLHPTYLRNIGRCHQNMGNAEEAILSFRDYLRKAPDLPASERQEVEGFIREMEALQEKQRQEQARPPEKPGTVVTPPPPTGGPPTGGAMLEPKPQPAGVNLQATQPSSQPESKPVYKRAWFWVTTGVVVAAAVVGGLWAGGVFDGSKCRSGYDCK